MHCVRRPAVLSSSNANISDRLLGKSYSQSLGPVSSAKYFFNRKTSIEKYPKTKSASEYHALSSKPIEAN